MPFMQHIAEFRRRLTIVVLTIVALSGVFYWEPAYKFALDVFLAPVQEYIAGGKLTVLGPFEQLTFRFKVALFASVIVSSPITIYHILAFIMPGLKERERRWLLPTTFAAIFLFLSGAAFAYFVIMGPAFQWLSAQGAGMVNSIPAADRYFSGIGMMLVGFGIGFELPLVVFYLIGFNVVPYDKVRGAWRYAYTGIVIVASMATPDWSPWTMGGLAGALIVLYEASLFLARIAFRKKIDEQRAEAAEEAAEAELDAIESAKQESRENRRKMLEARAEAARKRAEEAEAAARDAGQIK